MSKTGQYNYKGINLQAFAALSLFLQNINRSDFVEMILEGEKLEDFVLVYNSGKKIICESKYRSSGVGLYELKSIIQTVLGHRELKDTDQILIISNFFQEQVKSLVNNFAFWTKKALQEIKINSPKFSDEQIELIPQIRLWEVNENTNREGLLFLMYHSLANKNSFWLPKSVLEDWTNTLLVQNIYLKSECGERISKKNFLDQLEKKKRLFFENNGTDLQQVKVTSIQKIDEIVQLVEENNPSKRDVCSNRISELIANPSLHYETLRRLGQSTNLELDLWDVLWTASVSGVYSFEIFRIIKNNINSKENIDYSIEFINRILEEYLFNYYREEFIKNDIVEICKKIVEIDPELANEIFEVIQKLFKNSSRIFYYEERRTQDWTWGREKIADLLKKIYQSQSTNQALKQEIIEYIFDSFNLVEDNSIYWSFTPPAIFTIVYDYINENPKINLLEFSKIVSGQYQKFLERFNRKIKFDGWEHMGGGISQSGSEFSIDERQFLTRIFQPVLEKIPNSNEKWDYVNKNFITRKIEEVSLDKPDFLNRAVIPYLLDLYVEKDLKTEAFNILSDFVKMRKGIPWKGDIIYYYLSKGNYSPKQQWDLVQIGLDEYNNLPINVFVERIVTDLAMNDNSGEYQDKAIATLVCWANDPKYKSNRIFGSDIVDIILNLLNNPKIFNFGVNILETFINSDNFTRMHDTYNAWNAAKALSVVISKNIKKGINILEKIESNDILTVNQQIVLLGSLENVQEEKKGTILELYDGFIKKLLEKYPDIDGFETKFYFTSARESLVKFAELLSKFGYYDQSLKIMERFIEDSDPTLLEHQDNLAEHNLHQKVKAGEEILIITSVRGKVAWVLRYLSLLPARNYFAKAIPLLKKLCEDENFYIRVQSTYSLIEFMKNRDTYVIRENRKERFIDEATSNMVADIAFSMLRDKENQKLPAVLKGLAHVFSNYRYMDQTQALEVMTVLLSSDAEFVIRDVTSLLIFFAEFRKNAFKGWIWGELPEFNDEPFKEIILQQIESGKDDIRRYLSWEFWNLPKEGNESTESYNKNLYKTSINYFKEFVKQEYEKNIWEYIYHFIEDYLDYEFVSCINLWMTCVLKERPYLAEAIKDKDNIHDLNWRPFFHNGKILAAILKNLGLEEFLKWMEYLLDYPEEVLIAHDIEIAVSELSGLPKSIKGAEIVFDKLVKRYPRFFDDRAEWLSNGTGVG